MIVSKAVSSSTTTSITFYLLQCLLLLLSSTCDIWSVKCQTNGGGGIGSDGGGFGRDMVAHHHLIRPSQDQLTLSESIARGAAAHQQQPNGLLKGSSGVGEDHQRAMDSSGSLGFSCPTQFGHYRDTSNCAAYYICTFGQSLHKNCSTGLYFSERLQTCDWPTNVPCERDFASLAETSVYNLVDETSSTPVPRSIHHQNLNLASTAGVSHSLSLSSSTAAHTATTVPVLVNHRAESLPAADSSSLLSASNPSEDRAETTITITPPPTTIANTNTVGLRYSEHSTIPAQLTSLASASSSADKVPPPHFTAEESSKYTSAKYVVDGFEVPATENTRDDGNLYSESKDDAKHKQFLTSPENKQPKQHRQHHLPSGGNNRGNSTFREVSNLNGNNAAASSSSSTVAAAISSSEKTDKNAFQKRNDYDPYWAIGYSSNQPHNHNHPFMIEPEQPKSYIRHRPQNEPGLLIATNVNPYLNNKQPNSQSESYYVYDSSPPESSSPYRSRYQHRYHHNQQQNSRRPEPDLGSLQLTAAFSSQSRPAPQQSSGNDGASLLLGSLRTASPGLLSEQSIKPDALLSSVNYGSPSSPSSTSSSSSHQPLEPLAKPHRRKVPEVYIEVISADNLTAPYSILTDGGGTGGNGGGASADQSLYMIDSRPMKRLNYEINERLLAPFKQRELGGNGAQVNWLEKPVLSSVSGVNLYSHQPIYHTASPTSSGSSSSSNGGYRKKVVRKKKVSRPSTGMAVSSSTNLYGHSSTQLLTGALVTKPGSQKPNSRLPATSFAPPKIHQPKITTAPPPPTYTPEHNAGHNIELSGWRPVTPPASIAFGTSTTPSPLFSYDTNGGVQKLTSSVEYYIEPATSPAPPPAPPMTTSSRSPDVSTVEIGPKTVTFDFKDALKATYDSLAKQEKPQLSHGRMHKLKPKHEIFLSSGTPYRVKYSTSRPKKQQKQPLSSNAFAAHYNRYVVIPQNNQSAITVMFDYQNVSTPTVERSRFGLGDAIVTKLIDSSNTGRNKFSYDLSRIVTTESPLPPPPPSSPLSSAPIRDTLEDFIKRAIDPKISSYSTAINSASLQPNYTKGRSFPSLVSSGVPNYIETQMITLNDVAKAPPQRPPSPPRITNGQRRARKYRPLISLNQTTSAVASAPQSPSPMPSTSANHGSAAFTSQRIVTTISPLEAYHSNSGHHHQKSSINLNEPNTIYVYQSPKTNEVSEQQMNTGRTVLPNSIFTTTSIADTQQQSRGVYNFGENNNPATQAPPPLPTRPMTTSGVISEVEYDVAHGFGQTLPVTSTASKPTIQPRYRTSRTETMAPTTTTTTSTTPLTTTSITISTTTTTTTPAPPVVVSTSDSYGYYEDYDKDYGDYSDSDYKLMGNKSSVLSSPSLTTSTTTSTTTTSTTTSAPSTIAPYNYRRLNVTSKPLLYLSNRPRPTNRRLVIKDSSANQQVVLASRPKAMYPQPKALVTATKCEKRKCRLPDCRCGGSDIPGDLPNKQIPQLVMLTFDDGVNDLNWDLYEELLNSGRKNPNGCPLKATFYVSHEWTDYGQVQTLYSRGHEIASHTISHRFGEKFTKDEWIKEVNGQREILNLYGGVKFEDIRGLRAPFLQTGGNNMFEMLYQMNFTYDSSLPVQENSPPYWPYTLDYALSHSCNIPPCPTRSFPGIWEIGMVMWSDLRGGRCSMGDACTNPSDEAGVYEMLLKNFNRHYKSNRAPFSLYYHSAWFNTLHHKKGFIKFLDEILQNQDVYLVTAWQALQWVREPTPLSKLSTFEPLQCKKPKPVAECTRPKVCNVSSKQGSRTLRTCQECPSTYPWIGSTGFSKAKYG